MPTVLTKEQFAEFRELSRPLMKFLADNFNPHASIILNSTRAEVVSGIAATVTDEFIKD